MKKTSLKTKNEGILTFIDYKKLKYKIVYAVICLLLMLAAFVALFPAFWLFVTSFKTSAEMGQPPYHFWPKSFDIGKIAVVWKIARVERAFLNTLLVTLGAVFCSVLFNGLMGYALGIIKPAGHRGVFGVIMAGYMIPAMTSMAPLFGAIIKLGFINRWEPLMLAFGANAFYLVMFKSYFESLPKAVFEAARVDGCGRLRMFFNMVFPLSMPIIGVVCIFTATAAWSDFLMPYLVLRKDSAMTVMVKIYNINTRANDYQIGPDYILMLLTISVLPVVALFAIFQKRITSTATVSGIK